MTRTCFRNFDWPLLVASSVVLILGLFILGSVASSLIPQQIISLAIGLSLFFVFSQIDYRIFERLATFLFLLSLFILGMTFLFGAVVRGATRWLQIGGFGFQPSEMVKPFLVLFFAWFFSQQGLNFKRFFWGLFLLAVPVAFVFWQPDLGSSLVLIFSWLGIIFGAGLGWQWLFSGFLCFFLGLPLIWQLFKDYQRQRIISFLDPFRDPLGAGYNLIQATVAVGSGQWLGRGFGRGTQSQLKFLPERQTDFIFASLAEELGFMGSLILIFAFAVLFWRILVIAQETEDTFGYLICLGVFSFLFFQFLVNVGMNLGLLPVVGVPLPLVSYGGSSLVATLISLGLVENVARIGRKKSAIEIR